MLCERVNREILAVSADYIIVNGCHNQLIGETAAPHTRLNVIPDRAVERVDIGAVNNVERAPGEGVRIHHVHERCGAVNAADLRCGETCHTIQRFGVGNAENSRPFDKLAAAEIAAGCGEALVLGEQGVNGVEQGCGVGKDKDGGVAPFASWRGC